MTAFEQLNRITWVSIDVNLIYHAYADVNTDTAIVSLFNASRPLEFERTSFAVRP